jgi:hypothetical protein
MITQEGIKHRRIWGIYELYTVYEAMGTGIVSAIIRFVMLIVVALLGIMRVDRPLFPDWIEATVSLDSANLSFNATVLLYHWHNNPITITAANILRIAHPHVQVPHG